MSSTHWDIASGSSKRIQWLPLCSFKHVSLLTLIWKTTQPIHLLFVTWLVTKPDRRVVAWTKSCWPQPAAIDRRFHLLYLWSAFQWCRIPWPSLSSSGWASNKNTLSPAGTLCFGWSGALVDEGRSWSLPYWTFWLGRYAVTWFLSFGWTGGDLFLEGRAFALLYRASWNAYTVDCAI